MREITFRVEGHLPPKKDGANSMWRKPSSLPLLRAIRGAACRAMGGHPPFDEPVVLRLRVFLPASNDDLWSRRRHGDLDNFITGVCDALQRGGVADDSDWADVDPAAHPSCAIVFTDDSWVHRIVAEIAPARNGEVGYEVEVSALSSAEAPVQPR